MEEIGWIIAKIKCKFGGGKNVLNNYLRKKGIVIGDGTKTASNIKTSEPYLIEIGKNVTLSHDVDFITHDNSVCKIYGVYNDIYGKIKIGDNCFLGAHAIIMYGVTLADNVIVASGSVVTKSVLQSNVIIAGSPAKIIGTWDKFEEKTKNYVMRLGDKSFEEKKSTILGNPDKLITR